MALALGDALAVVISNELHINVQVLERRKHAPLHLLVGTFCFREECLSVFAMMRLLSFDSFRCHGLRLCIADFSVHGHGACNHASNISHIAWHDNGSALLSKFAESLNVLLRHTQADSSLC